MAAARILGMRVDLISYEEATEKVLTWAVAGESRYVCVANVHMVMEAHDDPNFRALVNAADLVTPDGMPLVWMLRKLGHPYQERVYGPELTLRVCAEAARRGVPVGFYGGHPEALEALVRNLRTRFPGLRVVYAYSPPFRPLTPKEDERITEEINALGCRILFVGLGCPKQERWMAEHKGKLWAVMLGVGAAFDFHAGRVRQAPVWMQRAGLEWLFRLGQEPRRLWRRYLKHNPRFLLLAFLQLTGMRRFA
ncbi:glycosyltransferase [Thermus scotoductus]|uniref:Glycosyltransferase n=1 Tax=Thermus scotoductus TaxID=37636 RepID=A0A430UDL3_THESC|nr:WecB/TagA/CpsF family glycosyltransferase [Thermus scotoductus]RTH96481.1 glycosyltransferase [Thermus scotoductus]